MAFKKAIKYDAKGRIALAGPAGSGKTYTALTLATALADGKEIALIDTERGSASKYADLFSFDVMELDTFHPDKFVAGIKEAEAAGYAVLVIDSLSHAWNGPGGLLEIVDQIARRSQSKNTFNAWGDATPIQQRLTDALTRANMHIIVTMRSKTEYVVEQNAQGKSVPRKVGTAPIQRDGMEYEFDVFADMDIDNTLIVQKSRCPALAGAVIAKPNAKVAETLKTWLSGEAAPVISAVISSNGHQSAQTDPPATDQQLASIRKLHQHLGKPEFENAEQIGYLEAKQMIGELSKEYREAHTPKPLLNGDGSVAQPKKLLDCYSDKLNALLLEFQRLQPQWCAKHSVWHMDILRSVLTIANDQPFPARFNEDDEHRFELYVESKREKAETLGK